jgi:hypothetical protein
MQKVLHSVLFCCLALAFSQNAFSQAAAPLTTTTPVATTTPPPAATATTAPTAPTATTPAKAVKPSSSLTVAGKVIWVKGGFKAIQPSQKPRVLARGNPVYLNDQLITDANSSAELSLTDNTVISLTANTNVSIDRYHFDTKNASNKSECVVKIVEGGFRSITGMIAKEDPQNYQVKTPVATIGVRGTDYHLTCRKDHTPACAFGLTTGEIELTNDKGSFTLNQDSPYATFDSPQSAPVFSKEPPAMLGPPPVVTPPKGPPPPGCNSPTGGCGINIG